MSIDQKDAGYSSQVQLFLELESGRRLSVAQVGRDSLIISEDCEEQLSGRMAKLIIVVDGVTDEYDVILSKYDEATKVAEFA